MTVRTRFLFLLNCSCFYHTGIAQQEEVSLVEIRFRKGGTAAKLANNCYQLTSNQTWTSDAIGTQKNNFTFF